MLAVTADQVICGTVVTQLGAPPAGHKYVRVASDILLLAIGTNMVVDALTDLSRI